jgi:flagellar biosynthesis protein FlhB
MSEVAEKPFEATPQRIAKARREGNVARSNEFAANLAFAAGALAVVAVTPMLVAAASRGVAMAAAGKVPAAACAVVVVTALVPAGCASLAGTLASAVQSAGITVVAIAPKCERLNPIEGVKRIFSRETFAHSLRAALAFAMAAAAMAPALRRCVTEMVGADGAAKIAAEASKAAEHVAFAACAVGFLFSIAEYAAARGAWLRKLRMTIAEHKQETKEQEGDALARGRRRAMHRALLRGALGRTVDASFVVANPTHVAVALEYRPPLVPVPHVLVRAAGEAAVRVRKLAASFGIPIVESVELARALYEDTRAGEPIPPVHYVAVAHVVAALTRGRER